MVSIIQAELEQRLSKINAKIAGVSDLVQKIGVLAIHYTGLLAEVQGDVEEIYLSLGDETARDSPTKNEHYLQADEGDKT